MSRVAIQGIKGSYSEEAAGRLLGQGLSVVECVDFDSVFAAVDTGAADYAVVPVRNRIVGDIVPVVKLIQGNRAQVYGRLELKVMHVLAGTQASDVGRINSVRSHIEALRQCSEYLAKLLSCTQEIGADTASSIRRIVEENDPQRAAIGSRRAAEIYGAKILAENIANSKENWTTFYLIGN
jgi:prephenate dehydratase